MPVEVVEEKEKKRVKRISKTPVDNGVSIVLEGFPPLLCEVDKLTDDIKTKCAIYGISQKVGDSAAGLGGEEAYNAMVNTWQSLVEGKWTLRLPGEKISLNKKAVQEKFADLSTEDQEKARNLLASFGLTSLLSA